MSCVNVVKESIPRFFVGHGTVGATPAQVTTLSLEVLKHVIVRATAGNTGTISVGMSSAQATDGFILAEGEQTPPIYIDDANKVWVVGSDADQDFSWIAN